MAAKVHVRVVAAALLVASAACGSSFSTSDPEVVPDVDAGPEAEAFDAGTSDAAIDGDAVVDAGADAADATDASDAAVDASDAGPPAPVVFTGASDRILLTGTVVTPDTAFDGEVLVEGPTITCVGTGGVCGALPAAAGATLVVTNGIIAPGMIDTHNHILFDIFDDSDWLPSKVYTNHDQWPAEAKYQAMLDVKQCLEDATAGKPTWCPEKWNGGVAKSLKCEMHKWGELKGLVAGTTSIVGLPGLAAGCMSSVARSIDVPQNGLGTDKVQTSALFPPSASSANNVCSNFTSGTTAAYLIHCGEGTDATALAEWTTLGTITDPDDCLYAPQTTITHGTAFTATEFAAMGAAGMKLTWSPKSNVALYGATTNIPAALDANVLVALAPDWSMGGSVNLLDEMRFADAWDDTHFADRLKPKDLVKMTTKNAAAVLALGDKIGTLAPGYLADIVVYTPKGSDPYASIVASRPVDVRMTMIGGRILYGDLVMLAATVPGPPCDLVDVCATVKFACVAESSTANKLGQTFAEIKQTLEDALVEVDSLTPMDGYSFAPLAPLVKCP